MARRKLEIRASETQIDTLHKTLQAGADLDIALQRAGITRAALVYWVAIASIVAEVKSREELEELEELAQSGVSVANVRSTAANFETTIKKDVLAYIEPTEASILQYKNSRRFRKFADRCYEIIEDCKKVRAEFAAVCLSKIARSTEKKAGINPSGAMWWLERNMPDKYAKPSDKALEQANETAAPVEGIQVEYIDPDTKEQRDRVNEMEQEIINDMKIGGKA